MSAPEDFRTLRNALAHLRGVAVHEALAALSRLEAELARAVDGSENALLDALRKVGPTGATASMLGQAAGVPSSTTHRVLLRLVRNGRARRLKSGPGAFRYVLLKEVAS